MILLYVFVFIIFFNRLSYAGIIEDVSSLSSGIDSAVNSLNSNYVTILILFIGISVLSGTFYVVAKAIRSARGEI